MQLIHEVETVLKGAGYRTKRTARLQDTIIFEDDTIVGFASAFLSVQVLVDDWQRHHDTFIRENAERLRRDRNKAWNVCAVFLTEDPPTDREKSLGEIEGDVNASRKIARAGLVTRNDVARALAPLLPLLVDGQSEPLNVDTYLLAKLTDPEKALFSQMRERTVADAQIANGLVAPT
jgi:hypothetical protein